MFLATPFKQFSPQFYNICFAPIRQNIFRPNFQPNALVISSASKNSFLTQLFMHQLFPIFREKFSVQFLFNFPIKFSIKFSTNFSINLTTIIFNFSNNKLHFYTFSNNILSQFFDNISLFRAIFFATIINQYYATILQRTFF